MLQHLIVKRDFKRIDRIDLAQRCFYMFHGSPQIATCLYFDISCTVIPDSVISFPILSADIKCHWRHFVTERSELDIRNNSGNLFPFDRFTHHKIIHITCLFIKYIRSFIFQIIFRPEITAIDHIYSHDMQKTRRNRDTLEIDRFIVIIPSPAHIIVPARQDLVGTRDSFYS